MTDSEIAELINRRRRQVLVHSVLYYRMNENLVSDSQWAAWAVELEELEKKYPHIGKTLPYADDFKNFEHSSGYNLPLHDSWAVNKAHQLLALHRKLKGE